MGTHRSARKSLSCNGKRLRYYRGLRSLTQSELARISGYSERLISKAEAGKPISVSTVEDLAEALSSEAGKITVDDLICDPTELAKKYIHFLHTAQRKMVAEIEHFLDDEVIFSINGCNPKVPFAGTHQGIEAMRSYVNCFFDYLEVPEGHDYRPHYKFFCEGNEVIIWGKTWIRPIGQKDSKPMLVNMRMRFEDGKMILFEDRFDVTVGEKIVSNCIASG